jgi:hypothetical protein
MLGYNGITIAIKVKYHNEIATFFEKIAKKYNQTKNIVY